MDLTEIITPRFSLMIRRKNGEYELGFAKLPEEELCFDAEENVQIEDLKATSLWYAPVFDEEICDFCYSPREIQLPNQKHFITSVDQDYSRFYGEKRAIIIDYAPINDDTEQARREFVMLPTEMEKVIERAEYSCADINRFIRAKAREQTGSRRKILRTLADARIALKEAKDAQGYENVTADLQNAFERTIDQPLCELSEQLYRRSFDINRKRVRLALKNYAYVRGIGEDIAWRDVA